MTTSRIPAVCDALVSILTTALTDATVYDGKYVTAPSGTKSFVTVGWTPEDEGPTGSQDWAGLGRLARDETFDIPCYADAYSGSTQLAARRNAAFALFAACENALRNDPTLGGALPQPGWSQIGEYAVRQEQTESGLDVGITFHVIGQTRI